MPTRKSYCTVFIAHCSLAHTSAAARGYYGIDRGGLSSPGGHVDLGLEIDEELKAERPGIDRRLNAMLADPRFLANDAFISGLPAGIRPAVLGYLPMVEFLNELNRVAAMWVLGDFRLQDSGTPLQAMWRRIDETEPECGDAGWTHNMKKTLLRDAQQALTSYEVSVKMSAEHVGHNAHLRVHDPEERVESEAVR